MDRLELKVMTLVDGSSNGVFPGGYRLHPQRVLKKDSVMFDSYIVTHIIVALFIG